MKVLRRELFLGLGLVVVLAMGAVSAAPTTPPSAGPTEPKLFGPKPFGKIVGKWQGRWWNWVSAYPENQTPARESGQVNCGKGQPPGKVWFLAGWLGPGPNPNDPIAVVTRECTIPKTKGVRFPILNAVVWQPEDCETEDECRDAVVPYIEPNSGLFCTVDNVPCTFHHLQVRTQSPLFTLHVPENSVLTGFGAAVGDHGAISDGYWVFLPPLGVGHHVIHFGGKVGDPVSFGLDVTYEITVE